MHVALKGLAGLRRQFQTLQGGGEGEKMPARGAGKGGGGGNLWVWME